MTFDSSSESVDRRAPIYMIRGIIAIAVGIYCIVNADSSVGVLARLFGALLVIEACLNLLKGGMILCDERHGSREDIRYYFLLGIANAIIALVLFIFPQQVASILILVIAIWFILLGFDQLRRGSDNGRHGCDIRTTVVAVLYLLVGLFFFFNTGTGKTTLVQVAGAIILIFGAQLALEGLRLQFGIKSNYLPVGDDPEQNPIMTV